MKFSEVASSVAIIRRQGVYVGVPEAAHSLTRLEQLAGLGRGALGIIVVGEGRCMM